MKIIWKAIRKYSKVVLNSIAFYPALISAGYLLLSVLMLYFDYSQVGKHLKANISWISLQDASTARSVVSSIAAGIISLTVFSFSMVMIVLNQAASQMSNRVLDIMISNRFQQVVLGIYLGTIVYALFLLSTIRDTQSGIYVPAMSIYLLVMLMVVDIFLFIYFIHYVTQTVKYETIIHIIHRKTMHSLNKQNHHTTFNIPILNNTTTCTINANESGYFIGFNEKQLIEFAKHHNVVIEFLHSNGSYLLKDTALLIVYNKYLQDEERKKLLIAIDFFTYQNIDTNPYFGFQQLSEVAVKALSPGINDGATAVSGIHALADLFAYYIKNPISSMICDDEEKVCVITKEKSFEELFEQYVLPIWHYGKNDPFMQRALHAAMLQLMEVDVNNQHKPLLDKIKKMVQKAMEKNALAFE